MMMGMEQEQSMFTMPSSKFEQSVYGQFAGGNQGYM